MVLAQAACLYTPAMPPKPTLHVALMRGLNVGGKNRLPMRDLAAIFDRAGATDVRTCIQSGNVVFATTPAAAKQIPGMVHQALEAEFDIRSPVIVRSAREFAAVLANVPDDPAFADETTRHIVFLDARPTKATATALDPDRSPGDSFTLVNREIFLALPNGAARSKLTNDYFDRTLQTISTARNWRTVLKLAEMLGVDTGAAN